MLRRSLLAAASAAALTLSAHGALAQDKLDVVASFSILGDMVTEIGGDHVELVTLVGRNGDPHVYEPTPSDARALHDADVLVVNGLKFEGWLPRLVDAADFAGTRVVATEGMDLIAYEEVGHDADHHDGEEHEEAGHHDDEDGHDDHAEEGHGHHHHGEYDPHGWQSLANGVIYARNIADALKTADPDNAEDYEARAADYIARMEALDAKLKQEFAALPEDRRTVVTPHDAFQYFGRAYGLTFVAPEGLSTEGEPSAADIARIIDQIREDKIAAVFIENISDDRIIQRIRQETGAVIGGELYSGALSEEGGPAATYLGMFEHNATQLTGALAGS